MNHITLIGRTTSDVELKTTQSGKNISDFCIAVRRAHTKDEIDFINCVAFEKSAQTISQYVKKGQLIAIEGRLQIRTYNAKDGSKRKSAEVVVDRFEFCETKSSGTSQTSPSVQHAFQYVPEQYMNPGAQDNFKEVSSENVDDLPF